VLELAGGDSHRAEHAERDDGVRLALDLLEALTQGLHPRERILRGDGQRHVDQAEVVTQVVAGGLVAHVDRNQRAQLELRKRAVPLQVARQRSVNAATKHVVHLGAVAVGDLLHLIERHRPRPRDALLRAELALQHRVESGGRSSRRPSVSA